MSEVQHGSHWAKIRASAGLCSFMEAVGENPSPCLFQHLKATCMCWLMAPSSIFKAKSFSCCPFLGSLQPGVSSTLRAHVIKLGPSHWPRTAFPSEGQLPLLPHQVTHSQVWETRVWVSLGPLYCLPQKITFSLGKENTEERNVFKETL